MRRWLPFVFIIITALALSFYLFLTADSRYVPAAADPMIVYSEACADCHGSHNRSGNFWSPNLAEELVTSAEVRKIIQSGTLLMPAFPAIKDSLLDSLALYVVEKKFN